MKLDFKAIFFFILIAVFALQCKKESTRWAPTYAFPVAFGTLDLTDVIDQDYIEEEGEVTFFHFNDTLEPIKVEEFINLGDTILEQVYSAGFSFGPFEYENGESIFGISEDFSFNLNQVELRSGKVKQGILKLVFESNSDGYLDLNYELAGVTNSDGALNILAQTDPASSSDPFTSELFIDISGYEIDFTGEDGTDRNTLIGDLDVSTSAEPSYTAQIYGTDEIKVRMELLELELEELRGYFGLQETEIDETVVLDSTLYAAGALEIADVSVELMFKNYFGVDAQIDLEEIVGVNSVLNTELNLESNQLFDVINVTRAIESSQTITPSSFDLSFNTSNSNLLEFINTNPNSFNVLGQATLNPLGDVTGGFDFYNSDFPFQICTDIKVPLCFTASGFTLATDLDVSELDDLENVKELKLNFFFSNDFPFGTAVNFYFPGETEPFSALDILGAESGTDPHVFEGTITLNETDILKLDQAGEIKVEAVLNTTDSEEVKINADQKIELTITAELTYEADI